MVYLLKQRYQIISKLGQGGMGAVYKAQDTNLGDRPVAVKEMTQSGLNPQEVVSAAKAFKQEADMLAGLHHPNLPSIHEHFEEAGRWYLVMEFIEGETLEDYLQTRGGKLPFKEVLNIGIQLCTVLDYLHTRQPPIIFRDLKPPNIMHTPEGLIYLIDFGIARHFKPGQTRDTANYGSAGYSPPEQYGQAQTTERSDIYSLGATLYHLLSGYPPARSPFRLPPLQSLDPTLPSRLVMLITQMLNLDAGRRPISVKAVAQELQQMAAPSAVPSTRLASPPPPPPPRVQGVTTGQVMMSSTSGSSPDRKLYNRSGIALLLAALCTLFEAQGELVSPLSLTSYNIIAVCTIIEVICILIALPGFYAKQKQQAGWIGTPSMVIVATAYIALGVSWIISLVLQQLNPVSYNASGAIFLLIVLLLGDLFFCVGQVLLGFTIIRARVYPHWTGITIITLGVVAAFIGLPITLLGLLAQTSALQSADHFIAGMGDLIQLALYVRWSAALLKK